ncbi:hypothetical protein CVT25_010372 [Psilocybe cyanescens]|uniref:Uncharacterized protein n=1 Tax=Psilocybe cyanescens TaxID=93625 RepID=A0A409XP33_PSICY|nr:hypothetical protein CVT25_010372 [Psilocybe cyanescens]
MGVFSGSESESIPSPVDIGTILNKPKTIQSLPKEILLRIFEEVYLASCNLEFDSYDAVTDPTVFPSCIAGVCIAWKELVQSIAHFSTQLLIFVDKPVPYPELRAQFRTSKPLLIKVFVIRKDYSAEEDVEERPRVKEVMQLLVQHIKRCKVVVFDLLHNSSLPRISDFSDKAAKLLTLRMKSRLPGFGPAVPDPTPTLRRNSRPFLCPSLRYLDLDGNVFMAAMQIYGWAESFREVSQKHLTIRNMRHSDRMGYDLLDFLVALSRLKHFTLLQLVNVELEARRRIGPGVGSIFIQNFEFEGLSRGFVTDFLNNHHNSIDVSHITLTRCELGPAPNSNFAPWFLTFCDIAPEEDLAAFIRYWDGFGLTFRNCPGVDDKVLLVVSSLSPGSQGHTINARTFRTLEIRTPGPIPITVTALKELVEVRQTESERYNLQEHRRGSIPLPMHSIYISGTGARLSISDLEWFRSKVDYFTWAAFAAPSDSPILDCDFSLLDASEFTHLDLYIIDPPLPPMPPLPPIPPLPPLSQTSAPDTPAVEFSSPPVSQPPPSSSPITGQLPPPLSQTPAPDSPIIDQDYTLLDWSIEELKNLP